MKRLIGTVFIDDNNFIDITLPEGAIPITNNFDHSDILGWGTLKQEDNQIIATVELNKKGQELSKSVPSCVPSIGGYSLAENSNEFVLDKLSVCLANGDERIKPLSTWEKL